MTVVFFFFLMPKDTQANKLYNGVSHQHRGPIVQNRSLHQAQMSYAS
jgi:hypothetical protein